MRLSLYFSALCWLCITTPLVYGQLPDALPILALPDDTMKAHKLFSLLTQTQSGTNARSLMLTNRSDAPLLASEVYRIGVLQQSDRWSYHGAWLAGSQALFLRQTDSAIAWFSRANTGIAKQYTATRPDRLASLYSALGSAWRDKGEFTEAIKYFYEAMAALDESRHPTDAMLLYDRIGSCYRRMENDQQAEVFTRKALVLAEKHNNVLLMHQCMANLGLTYKRQKRYPEALALLERVARESQQPNIVAPIAVNLGGLALEMNQSAKAATHYSTALELGRKHNLREPHARAHLGLAETHTQWRHFAEAEMHLDSADFIARKHGLDWIQMDVADIRAVLADSMGNRAEYMVQQRLYYRMRDSLLRGNDIPAIAEIVASYERQKKAQEITHLKTRNWLTAGIGIAAVLLLGLLLAFVWQRNLALKRAGEADTAQLAKTETEIRLLGSELTRRDESLEAASQLIANKNKMLLSLRGLLDQQATGKSNSLRNDLIALIQAIETDVSETYSQSADEPHAAMPSSFLDKLKTLYPDLTQNQIRLCAYLRMGYSSADIARLVGIEETSVKVARSRLRKKFGIQADDSFEAWFEALA